MTLEANFTPTTQGTGASQLQVFVSRVETTTRVVLAGELDGASALPLAEQLSDVASDLVGDLVVDIGLLTFIDSTGLSLLLSLQEMARASGRPLIISDPTPMARRLFQITGLDQRLRIEPAR